MKMSLNSASLATSERKKSLNRSGWTTGTQAQVRKPNGAMISLPCNGGRAIQRCSSVVGRAALARCGATASNDARLGDAVIVRRQGLATQASPAPDQAKVASDLCDREVIAVLAAVVWGGADRGSVREEIQTRLQDDFGAISRHTFIHRLKESDSRHNTANPVGG
jgi:hypothetical protein